MPFAVKISMGEFLSSFSRVVHCSRSGYGRAPEVPDEISVGTTNKVHFHGFALGVQIYTWNGNDWGSAVPRATLFDDDGNIVATHFGTPNGPAWRSNSGSEVVGKLPPKRADLDPDNAIPWLLLEANAKLTHGPGVLAGRF